MRRVAGIWLATQALMLLLKLTLLPSMSWLWVMWPVWSVLGAATGVSVGWLIFCVVLFWLAASGI